MKRKDLGYTSCDSCPICGNSVILRWKDFPSFIHEDHKRISIYECCKCNVSFAYPLEIDQSVYDKIYLNSGNVGGYNKYKKISLWLKASDNPLCEIKNLGAEYYFIVSEIEKHYKENQMILEIGCGFGYMTYALNSAHFRTIGCDISSEAITHARHLYGDFYIDGGIQGVIETGNKFDYVILSEVIEHVSDPMEFIASLKSLLRPGGVILLTTPNKSAFPRKALWVTDIPPIHLWWFSRESIEILAMKNGLNIIFAETSRHHINSFHYLLNEEMMTRPILPANEKKSIDSEEINQVKLGVVHKAIRVFSLPYLIKIRNLLSTTYKTEIPYTMCVKLSLR